MKFYLNFFFVFNKKNIIKGVYKLYYKSLFFSFENQKIQLSKSVESEKNAFYRFNKILYKNTYFNIKHSDTNLKFISSSNNEINVLLSFQSSENALWTFFEFGQNNYKIYNKNKCFIKIINLNIYCPNITLEEATPLQFLKIYDEISNNESDNDNELIDKEPIDILIK